MFKCPRVRVSQLRWPRTREGAACGRVLEPPPPGSPLPTDGLSPMSSSALSLALCNQNA